MTIREGYAFQRKTVVHFSFAQIDIMDQQELTFGGDKCFPIPLEIAKAKKPLPDICHLPVPLVFFILINQSFCHTSFTLSRPAQLKLYDLNEQNTSIPFMITFIQKSFILFEFSSKLHL